jgi:hypothetical protein
VRKANAVKSRCDALWDFGRAQCENAHSVPKSIWASASIDLASAFRTQTLAPNAEPNAPLVCQACLKPHTRW